MPYIPPIPLQPWQIVLAPLVGVFALATAGLPLLVWWWRERDRRAVDGQGRG